MLVERIDRVRDEKGLDTKQAYVYFEGQTTPVLLDFPFVPVASEVELKKVRGKTFKFVDAYIPVSVPVGDLDKAKECAELFYKLKDFVSYANIVKYCNDVDRPLTAYRFNPFGLITMTSADGKAVARFKDIDAGFTPVTFEMRLEELRCATREVLMQNECEGHTYMFYQDFCSKLNSLLKMSHHELMSNQSPSAILNYFSDEFYMDNYLGPKAKIALKETRDVEYNIYNAVISCSSMVSPFSNFEINEEDSASLSKEQRDAVVNSMTANGRLSIVTGGPGTGKTTVLSLVVDGINAQYPMAKIAMLAPTGKAAKRIGEVMGGRDLYIGTIHKFIGFGNNYITKEQIDEMASYDLIILDESSMADIFIFWDLIKCINLETTKLLLVGDKNQLPSVGAGNLLSDLISLKIPTFRLTKNFRSAGLIAENATKVINGDLFLKEGEEFKIIDTGMYSYLPASMATSTGIKDSVDIATISPYRREEIVGSTSEINSIVQSSLFNSRTNRKLGKFFIGDRVIFTSTCYRTGESLGYYNGDSGIVVSYSAGVYTVALDDNKYVEVENEDDIELAYAITIHKSQGSEYKEIIIAIPKASKFITRRMLYTAITRAKEKVTIFASPEVIRATIANNEDDTRRTFLSFRADTM